MSSKIITKVFATVVVSAFAYFAVADAVSIKQNLQKQNEHIQQLSAESEKLDQELDKTVEVKEQSQAEVEKLEQETQNAIQEREKLEKELGAGS